MKEYLVLSLIGSDRTGLVDQISEAIMEAGANLEDSRMAVLGGEFAMIMLCSMDQGQADQLESRVRRAAERLELVFTSKKTTARRSYRGTVPLAVQVRGMDHEGIVHDLVHHMMERGVAVETLDSHVTNAPYSGTLLFSMNMRVEAPAAVSLAGLRKSLEEIAERLNVDVEVDTVPV
ncbi:MAG: hypothetical protein HY319_14365 [Armatimonadetes bacterium]|nr:hypothetical protein [Armatimonadota bacterium]